MKIKKNILLIIKESYRWRHRELLEPRGFVESQLTLKNFIRSNSVLFIIGLILSMLLYPYISEAFAGYIISSLSIFVGLFTSVLILIFDKYVGQKKSFEESGTTNTNLVLQQRKVRNFSKQFVYISLESLLIAVTLIALLLIPLLLKNAYLKNIFHYNFITIFDWKLIHIKIFIINSVSFISRTFIIMLLYNFIKYLFYIFGSLGSFLMGVFKNHIRL